MACGGARTGECIHALTESDTNVVFRSSGSHALARVDLTLDLATRRISGTSFTAQDGIRTVPVDRVLEAEAFTTLTGHLRQMCGTADEAERQPVAGGTTTIEIVGPHTSRHVVRDGAPLELADGTAILVVDGDAFQRAVELFPTE